MDKKVPNMAPAPQRMTTAQEVETEQLHLADPPVPTAATTHSPHEPSGALRPCNAHTSPVGAKSAAIQQVASPATAAADQHAGQPTPTSPSTHAPMAACIGDPAAVGQQAMFSVGQLLQAEQLQHRAQQARPMKQVKKVVVTGAPGKGATTSSALSTKPSIVCHVRPHIFPFGVSKGACKAICAVPTVKPSSSNNNMPAQPSLMDCPLAVMLQLLRLLDSTSMLALFSTCKTLQGIVLSLAHIVHLEACLGTTEDMNRALCALQLASRHDSCVSLSLKEGVTATPAGERSNMRQAWDKLHSTGTEGDEGGVDRSNAWLQIDPTALSEDEDPSLLSYKEAWATLYRTMAGEGGHFLSGRSDRLLQTGHSLGVLQRVTRLSLNGVQLDALLPPVVGLACPKLASLQLHHSKLRLGPATVNTFTSYSRLNSLEVHDVQLNGCAKGWKQHLHQQIGQLTALTRLALTCHQRGDPEDHDLHDWEIAKQGRCVGALYGAIIDAMVPAVAGSLVHLQLAWPQQEGTISPETVWCMAGLGSCLTSLQSLDLQLMHLDDRTLLQLLHLPCLRTVSVDTDRWLDRSFAGQPCHWTTLKVPRVTLRMLARLPLHAKLRLKTSDDSGFIFIPCASTDAMISEALSNIKNSLWAAWDRDTTVRLIIDRAGDMAKGLPLLTGVSHLRVESVASAGLHWMFLSRASLAPLVTFVSAQECRMHLEFESRFSWDLQGMQAVVQSMPAGSRLTVHGTSEQTLIQLCCAARSCITLHTRNAEGSQGGFGTRVRAAVSAGTKRYVEVSVEGPHVDSVKSWGWTVKVH